MRIAIYNLHFQTMGGGERRTAAMAQHLAKQHEVFLFSREPVDTKAITKLFGIDLCGVEIIPLAGKGHPAEIAALEPDLLINNSHGSELVCPAEKGIYMCMFPEAGVAPPTSYDCVTANSRFTARSIRKLWRINAEVVYSACVDMGPTATKEKIILNVGRFFTPTEQSHDKRQDLLLETFRRMPEAQKKGWELHLVGNIGAQSADPDFVAQLQERARGLPVRFHFNLELPLLRELYRSASLYWHATGYGFDADLDPLKQEHFGMSIVEAMSAGVVPLAFNGGGPRETFTPKITGFHWSKPDELRAYARRLLRDDLLRERMSKEAVLASRRFTHGAFQARMDAIVARVTASLPEASIACAY